MTWKEWMCAKERAGNLVGVPDLQNSVIYFKKEW